MATIKSIEEKAKSFKEALSRAKGFYKRFPEYKEILEKIFPELKESEDEKTKRVLHSIANKMSKHLRDIFSEEEFQCYDAWSNAWLKKQGEQKSLSEEDENIIEWLIGYLEYQIMNVTITEEKDNCLDAISMLKSLKDRVQPKQEWSEEDESHIRYLIECLEHCKKGVALTMTTSTSQEYINWLKSLKPQNTWKPSDEMLEALYRVIPENVMEKSEDEMLLDKLYQGLKYGRVLSEK